MIFSIATHYAIGSVLALAWLSRVIDTARGMPSLADIATPQWDHLPPAATSGALPRVSVIVPARNEEARVGDCLSSLLRLDYPNYEVFAIDDRSTDSTGAIMDRLAASPENRDHRLKVLHITDLPSGWLGKPHAMWTAEQQASGDWLLLTDADVIYRADSVRRALAYVEESAGDHIVLFPTHELETWGEKMMIAAFGLLFIFGHRPWKVSDPKSKDHLGFGAFNLVRRRVYDAIGAMRALRMEVIEDMKLGKLVKEKGFAQRCAIGDGLLSLKWAHGALGICNNLTKNFFALMLFRWPRALGACLLLLFLNVLPFAGVWLAPAWAKLPYAVALASLLLLYIGISLRAPISPLYFFLHPLSTFLLIFTMLRSMISTLWHDGVTWRDTHYSLDELRRGLV